MLPPTLSHSTSRRSFSEDYPGCLRRCFGSLRLRSGVKDSDVISDTRNFCVPNIGLRLQKGNAEKLGGPAVVGFSKSLAGGVLLSSYDRTTMRDYCQKLCHKGLQPKLQEKTFSVD